jgi:hypothetical protein
MLDLGALRRRAVVRIGAARSVADGIERIGCRHRGGLRGRNAREEGLQHDEPRRDRDDGATARRRGEYGWHVSLSRGTLAHLIFRKHPRRRT